eukprot:TRINITY_DN12611_c0_g1_i1.p1 TRINITY_DN12611_c0_g1~~TRINITY_DN12611_c0_g1_i1.p1  ORF type:complete len:191 (-),score=47.88 TRINITY_DN12611_c0_g1_i1:276-848(-)
MLRSLVGSEMCIRDSSYPTCTEVVTELARRCNVALPSEKELHGHMAQFVNVDQGNMISEEEFQTVVFEIFAAVDQAVFLEAVGYYNLPFAGTRDEVLTNFFQRHNRETMQAGEMRDILSRFAARADTGAPPTDEELDQTLASQFSGVKDGKGVVTLQEFVDYFVGQFSETNDTEFFTTMQYLWHGYLNFY